MKLLKRLFDDSRVIDGAILTSFPFTPDYFEATILRALRRKGVGTNTVALVDDRTYDRTLTESGRLQPTGAGQEYYLAPVEAPASGTFHPKIAVLAGEKRLHAFVGSANLTQQAYTSNQEIVTHLQYERGAEDPDPAVVQPLGDIRQYLLALLESQYGERIGHVPTEQTRAILDTCAWIEAEPAATPADPALEFVHNLETPLLDQVLGRIDAAGESITDVSIAAPFYGGSTAIPATFTDRGIQTTLWLQDDRTQIEQAAVQAWTQSTDHAAVRIYESDRYVHGKLLVINTETASYCLSGSPNASRYALTATPAGSPDGDLDAGNHEAALLRREPTPGHFEYLFEEPPFDDPIGSDLESFSPGSTQYEEPSGRDEHTEDLTLLDIQYTTETALGRPELTVRVRAPPVVPDGTPTLQITTISPEHETCTLSLGPPQTSDADDHLVFTQRITSDSVRTALGEPARGVLQWNGHSSRPRWIDSESPDATAEVEHAASNAGADAIPSNLPDYFLGDADRQTELYALFTGILSGIKTRAVGRPQSTEADEDPEAQERRRKLTIPTYTEDATVSDLAGRVESLYDQWLEDIRDRADDLTVAPVESIEAVETDLRAWNRTSALVRIIAAAARARGDSPGAIPDGKPVATIRELYSQPNIRGENDAIMPWYCDRARRAATSASDSDPVYEALRDHFVPNIIVTAIIAETQIASTTREYVDYYDWHIEQVLVSCFPTQTLRPDHLQPPRLSETLEAVSDVTSVVTQAIEHRGDLRRHAPRVFTDEAQLEAAVHKVLARAALVSGEGALTAIQQPGVALPGRFESYLRQYVSFHPTLDESVIR